MLYGFTPLDLVESSCDLCCGGGDEDDSEVWTDVNDDQYGTYQPDPMLGVDYYHPNGF